METYIDIEDDPWTRMDTKFGNTEFQKVVGLRVTVFFSYINGKWDNRTVSNTPIFTCGELSQVSNYYSEEPIYMDKLPQKYQDKIREKVIILLETLTELPERIKTRKGYW